MVPRSALAHDYAFCASLGRVTPAPPFCGITAKCRLGDVPVARPIWRQSYLSSNIYYNAHRTHASLNGLLPEPGFDGSKSPISIGSYRWQKHCRGLYQTPMAPEL